MSMTSFNCPTCGAGLDASDTNAPTVKCRFCSTVIKNPFYKADNAANHVAMPVININVGTNPASAQPAYGRSAPAAYGYAYAPARTESTRNRWVTLFLSLCFGWFGVHRFYTGHVWIGIVQLLTFGGLGLWNIIDMFLIVTGAYRDREGLPLRGSGISKKAALVTVALLMIACGGLAYIGETASKVDVPAEQGWITGINRCQGSSSFGEVVHSSGINLWTDWGDSDRGSAIGMVKHGDAVKVLKGRRHTGEGIYYQIQTESGLKGWITEEFIQFQPLSEGTIPRDDC